MTLHLTLKCALVSCVLLIAMAINIQTVWAICTTKRFWQACTKPPTFTKCLSGSEMNCASLKEQQKANGYFGCAAGSMSEECVLGASPDNDNICYTEYDCKWEPQLFPHCQIDLPTGMTHYDTEYVTINCGT